MAVAGVSFVMDAAGVEGNRDIRQRSAVIQIETEEEVQTRHEQTTQAANGDFLENLSPLIKSMRLFGLYFTRKPLVAPESTNQLSRQGIRGCQSWNPARIYATFVLVVTWLNALRNCFVFDGNETVGADLFTKLGTTPGVLLIAMLHTTCYVASHLGSLHKIFRQTNFSTSDFSVTYSRRAKVVTVVCWLLTTIGVALYIYFIFIREQLHDYWLMLVITTFGMSKLDANILKIVSIVLQLQTMASWAFTQAMNTLNIFSVAELIVYSQSFVILVLIELSWNNGLKTIKAHNAVIVYGIVYSHYLHYFEFLWKFSQAMNYVVVSLLYDQFGQLNDEFGKRISDRGEFSGNFGQFRRRHQAIGNSVQEADRFLMISNVAYFCFQIISIIFVFYSTTFYRDDTVSLSADLAFLYIVWLSISVLGLSLTTGQAIFLNHKASTL